ncbi:MAG TPA: hypothetical protein VGD01_05840 [Candidatus Elarobacter sp.]
MLIRFIVGILVSVLLLLMRAIRGRPRNQWISLTPGAGGGPPGSGGAGAGDRSPVRPVPPQLSGGAAKRLADME